ncbi:MAG: hypothetical protein CMM39_12790 [Rhodospirillaceae bacterium]|nr:hypothetical protein [Rhodospirillaceae bacterium]
MDKSSRLVKYFLILITIAWGLGLIVFIMKNLDRTSISYQNESQKFSHAPEELIFSFPICH